MSRALIFFQYNPLLLFLTQVLMQIEFDAPLSSENCPGANSMKKKFIARVMRLLIFMIFY